MLRATSAPPPRRTHLTLNRRQTSSRANGKPADRGWKAHIRGSAPSAASPSLAPPKRVPPHQPPTLPLSWRIRVKEPSLPPRVNFPHRAGGRSSARALARGPGAEAGPRPAGPGHTPLSHRRPRRHPTPRGSSREGPTAAAGGGGSRSHTQASPATAGCYAPASPPRRAGDPRLQPARGPGGEREGPPAALPSAPPLPGLGAPIRREKRPVPSPTRNIRGPPGTQEIRL